MDRQAIFNRVYTHLMTQNARSVHDTARALIGDACAYRGAAGRKCAIGCLIDDAHYIPELEGDSLHGIGVQHAVEKSLGCAFSSEDFDMLRRLQIIHDDAPVYDWARRLSSTASYHRLTIPETPTRGA